MLKKILTIVLSMVLVLSAFGVSAEVIPEDSGKITYTDDFDSATAGTYNTKSNRTDAYYSDVFSVPEYTPDLFTDKENDCCGFGEIIEYTEPDNTTNKVFRAGLNPNPYTVARALRTRELDLGSDADGNWYEFSYDFKYSDSTRTFWLAEGLFWIQAGDLKIQPTDSICDFSDATNSSNGFTSTGVTCAADTWYHIEVIAHDDVMWGKFYDANGNILASSNVVQYASADKKLGAYRVRSGHSGFTISLDNAMLVEYNPATVNPSCESSTISNNAEDVQRNVTLCFNFDQDVLIDATQTEVIVFGKINEEETVTAVSGASLSLTPGSRAITVNYTGLLERNTKYVVSFANVKNTEGLYCTDTYYFTTEDLHLWKPVTIEEIGSPAENLTPITFTIEDEYDYPTFDGEVLVMVYQEGKMLAYDMQTLTSAPVLNEGDGEDTCTINFNLGTVSADAEVCIALLDCVYGPIPLAVGTTN
ncbi:MAG: Ig-like domain-containing protein [Clostridia bacterium]|nr:Ig-like domain-containing protein [Clostridia bacterium]